VSSNFRSLSSPIPHFFSPTQHFLLDPLTHHFFPIPSLSPTYPLTSSHPLLALSPIFSPTPCFLPPFSHPPLASSSIPSLPLTHPLLPPPSSHPPLASSIPSLPLTHPSLPPSSPHFFSPTPRFLLHPLTSSHPPLCGFKASNLSFKL